MKIYMDSCCFNRPFDDQSQVRVQLETEYIVAILERCRRREWQLVVSDIIEWELSRTSNQSRLEAVMNYYSYAAHCTNVTEEVASLAQMYALFGIKKMDSLHLALAVRCRVDVLLTTDDQFVKAAAKAQKVIRVENPMFWMEETP